MGMPDTGIDLVKGLGVCTPSNSRWREVFMCAIFSRGGEGGVHVCYFFTIFSSLREVFMCAIFSR